MKKILGLLMLMPSIAFSAPSSVTCWTKLIRDSQTGAYANYWCNDRLDYDITNKIVKLYVNGWVSKKEKLAGSQPLLHRVFDIPDSTNPQLGLAGNTFLSGFVKAQPEFLGSIADQ